MFEARVALGLAWAKKMFERPLIVCHGGVIEAIFGGCGLAIDPADNSVLYQIEGACTENEFRPTQLDQWFFEDRQRKIQRQSVAPARQLLRY